MAWNLPGLLHRHSDLSSCAWPLPSMRPGLGFQTTARMLSTLAILQWNSKTEENCGICGNPTIHKCLPVSTNSIRHSLTELLQDNLVLVILHWDSIAARLCQVDSYIYLSLSVFAGCPYKCFSVPEAEREVKRDQVCIQRILVDHFLSWQDIFCWGFVNQDSFVYFEIVS